MLKKKYRLRKSILFSAAFRLKNCKSNEFFIIYCGSNKKISTDPTKAGFVVSKKVHKRAVKRNKIKRRLREIYYSLQRLNELPDKVQNSVSVVIIAKSAALNADFDELRKSFCSLIKKF